MKYESPAPAAEDRCDRLGDLAAAIPVASKPDLGQWSAIERRLPTRPRKRRRLMLLVPVTAGFGLLMGIGSLLRLNYQTSALDITPQGLLKSAPDRPGKIAFNDGSRFELGPASSGEVSTNSFRRGANLRLHAGRATVSVVHRYAGLWHVLAGPFDVRVTGTAFTVDWNPTTTHFRVRVDEGTVRVSGSPLNGATPVGAGQSLDIDAGGKQVTWNRSDPPEARIDTTTQGRFVPVETSRPPSARPVAAPGTKPSSTPTRGARKPQLAMRSTSPDPATTIPVPLPPYHPVGMGGLGSVDDGPGTDDSPKPMNPSGALFVEIGSRARFQGMAVAPQTHVYEDNGRMCTHVRLAPLSCAGNSNIAGGTDCDWGRNWGMAFGWYPRVDHRKWGTARANKLSFDFQATAGHYRLIAHVHGDPSARVYCIDGYASGRVVSPRDFHADCWKAGGRALADFAAIDYFAIQHSSGNTAQTLQICLSSVNLE